MIGCASRGHTDYLLRAGCLCVRFGVWWHWCIFRVWWPPAPYGAFFAFGGVLVRSLYFGAPSGLSARLDGGGVGRIEYPPVKYHYGVYACAYAQLCTARRKA